MATLLIEGQNVKLYKKVGADWLTPIFIGCANGISVKSDAETIEVMCDSTGFFPSFDYSKMNATLSVKGVYYRYTSGELTTNYGADEFLADQLAKVKIDIQWGNALAGEKVYRAKVLIKSVSLDHQNSQGSTYSVELQVDGLITSATIA